MVRGNGEITTEVFGKSGKFPVHWSSKIPVVRYKRNAITRELHWPKWIASDFNKELKRIGQNYRNARFLLKCTKEAICKFERGKEKMILSE